jgi:hypothetical protein
MRVDIARPKNRPGRQAAAMAIASALCIASSAPMAAIVDSGPVSLSIPATNAGLYLNLVTGGSSGTASLVPGWDFNPFRRLGDNTLNFFATIDAGNVCGVVATGGVATALPSGFTIGPSSDYATGGVEGTNFRGDGIEVVGIFFNNESTSTLNYGYLILRTTSPAGFPATILRYVYENTGASITVPGSPPNFLSASSRKVHGAAGTFDLPLSAVMTDPTTEPRQGPTVDLVFRFDKPMTLTGATFSIPEGTAGFAGASAVGNDIVLNFSGVADQQYLTISLVSFQAVDGGAGGPATVRLGLLAGDVSQSRVVTVADLGLVNAQLAQPVTAANYLKDVNASGTLSVADKGITNSKLTHNLPAP